MPQKPLLKPPSMPNSPTFPYDLFAFFRSIVGRVNKKIKRELQNLSPNRILQSPLNILFWLVLPLGVYSLDLSEQESLGIAQKIWQNECNQTLEGLLTWNAGEEFASLGIGHFIWYPKGKEAVFVETFPNLIEFFKSHRVSLPYWLTPKTPCPWHSREEFIKEHRSSKMQDLQKLLTRTLSLQAQFMAHRFKEVEKELTLHLTQSEQEHVRAQITRLAQTENGPYALLDYLNFKGSGLNIKERYQGRGWGLLQVLLKMPGNTPHPLEEFANSAKLLLSDRVELAPPERKETRWLTGWHRRVATYTGTKN